VTVRSSKPDGFSIKAFAAGRAHVLDVLRIKDDAVKEIAVFPLEPLLEAISGGERGSFLIQRWTGLVMPHWDPSKVDNLEPIGDDEAVEMTLRLSREEGIFAGISSGANVIGAHRLAERLGPNAVIVALAVDTGFKYLSVSPFAELA
jgi:cysteine synthase A